MNDQIFKTVIAVHCQRSDTGSHPVSNKKLLGVLNNVLRQAIGQENRFPVLTALLNREIKSTKQLKNGEVHGILACFRQPDFIDYLREKTLNDKHE